MISYFMRKYRGFFGGKAQIFHHRTGNGCNRTLYSQNPDKNLY